MASHFVKLEFVYMTSLFRSFVLFLFSPKKKGELEEDDFS